MTTATAAVRKAALTTWEGIWYVLQNIAFGAGYFAKVPAKKAMQDFGLTEMTGAENFWYIVQCIAFGAGYFAKIPTAKALSELPQYRSQRQAEFGKLDQAPTPLSVPSAPPTVPAAPTDGSEGSGSALDVDEGSGSTAENPPDSGPKPS
jgi:hypothetical protein